MLNKLVCFQGTHSSCISHSTLFFRAHSYKSENLDQSPGRIWSHMISVSEIRFWQGKMSELAWWVFSPSFLFLAASPPLHFEISYTGSLRTPIQLYHRRSFPRHHPHFLASFSSWTSLCTFFTQEVPIKPLLEVLFHNFIDMIIYDDEWVEVNSSRSDELWYSTIIASEIEWWHQQVKESTECLILKMSR
jgi:hypothetical protein